MYSQLLRLLLGLQCFIVLILQFRAATDVLEHFNELLRVLSRHAFHVTLENQKVSRLEEYTNFRQRFLVLLECAGLAIDAVLARTLGGDDSSEHVGGSLRQFCLQPALFLLGFLVLVGIPAVLRLHVDECGLGAQRGISRRTRRAKYQVLHLTAPQVTGLDAQDEGYGVHEVGFSRSIGPDHACKVEKGSYLLLPGVGFEVLELEVLNRHCCVRSEARTRLYVDPNDMLLATDMYH